MKNQITNGFDRITVNNLLIKARFITTEMAAHAAYFPQPDPDLKIVGTAIDDLQAAALAAENRDQFAISYRNDKKAELVVLLRKLGIYVNLRADQNLTIVLASGFTPTKQREPSPAIEFVDVAYLKGGPNAGEINSSVKAVKGARMYQHLISADENLPVSQWQTASTTKTKHTFIGLNSAKRYFVRIAAIGTNNQMVYNEAASFVTQ